MIVTFLYRIRDDPLRHGKYIGPCPIYEEGLDRALLDRLAPLFQQFYRAEKSEVRIGVVSADREAKDYYSEEEKHVFDLLYCKWPAMEDELFVQGIRERLAVQDTDCI